MARKIIEIDDKKLQKRLKRIERRMEREGIKGVQELGRWGEAHARMSAPRRTGRLASNVLYRKIAKGNAAEIRSINPINDYPGEPKPRNISNFSLPKWMATSPNAIGHARTGNPRYMGFTLQELRNRAPVEMQKRMRLIVN